MQRSREDSQRVAVDFAGVRGQLAAPPRRRSQSPRIALDRPKCAWIARWPTRAFLPAGKGKGAYGDRD